jgi:acyl carrier protein
MTNLEKYNKAFTDTFTVEEMVLNEQFNKNNIGNWDSVHQLSLVTYVEELFDIMLDTEDIIEFTSYVSGKEILTKYDVQL